MIYNNYIITYNPKPVPTNNFDWDFFHEEYDGAPDSKDNRCGCGKNILDCINQVKEIELECTNELD